jgi:chaperonin GroES
MSYQDTPTQEDQNSPDTDEYGAEGQEQQQPDQDPGKNLTAQIESSNLADGMNEDKLRDIGRACLKGYQADEQSRAQWLTDVDKWTDLAKLTVQPKNYPWANASNVKYPLLSTAAMQFAARAYPSLIPSNGQVVTSRVVGKDPQGDKTQTAEAVAMYMSYQILEEIDGWEQEMDRLLMMLPVVGIMFKKTYWDPIRETYCSHVILPQNLVVDYWAKSLETAERISEIFEVNERVMKERQNAGIWLKDLDLGAASTSEQQSITNNIPKDMPAENDEITPYVFVEQHTYLDLDDDEYKEPYIVTFHRSTGKVVRIVPRFDHQSIHLKDDKIVAIDAIHYYTKFGFVPNPDGSFYDIGFGILLGPINESVNTLINQLG